MGYMAGNLTRRFRSGRPAPRQCPSAYACVIEVVTSTFEDIVLDETKVRYTSLGLSSKLILGQTIIRFITQFVETNGTAVLIALRDRLQNHSKSDLAR